MSAAATKRAEKAREKSWRGHRDKVQSDFARRHPSVAKQESTFRKARKAGQRDHGHKLNGTVETLRKAAFTQQGALARMFEAGHLSIEQLAASQSIRAVIERIGRDVCIGSASYEARVDTSRSGNGAFFEALGSVRAEVAYGNWRASLPRPNVVLAMIAEDQGYTVAAKAFGMRNTTAKALLVDALDSWSAFIGDACDEVQEADLLAMQSGIV